MIANVAILLPGKKGKIVFGKGLDKRYSCVKLFNITM
jgi:hypothetical protein